jgi:hypothetical protein
MSDHDGRIEEVFENGDFIVALDGPVLQVFYGPLATCDSRHVRHVNIDFTKDRHGETTHMVIGSKQDREANRNVIKITEADKTRINAMIEEAIARGATKA